MLTGAFTTRFLPRRLVFVTLFLAGVTAAAYAARGSLAAALRAPYACGLGSGCVDVSPILATSVMLAFVGALLAVAIWQIASTAGVEVQASTPLTSAEWRLGLILLLVIALGARLLWVDLAQWQRDETIMAWLTTGGLADGHLPLTGNPATGNANRGYIPYPPGQVYLLAPAFLPFLERPGAPIAGVALIAGLSALSSVLCAWLVRRWFGSQRAGLAAGFAFALGFWPMFAGRQVWNPTLFPAFVLLYLDALLLLALARRGWAVLWAGVWLVVLAQLHYASLSLAPLLLAALVLGRRSLARVHAFAALVAAALLFIPFLYWELSFTTALRDVRELLYFAQDSSGADLSSLRMLANIASAGNAEGFIEPYAQALNGLAKWPLALASSGLALLVVGVLTGIAVAIRTQDQGKRVAVGFVLALLLLPVALLIRHSIPLAQFHLYLVLPAVAITMGIAVGGADLMLSLPGPISRVWNAAGVLLLASYSLGSVLMLMLILTVVANAPTQHYGLPAGVLHRAGQAVHDAWRLHGQEQPVYAGGHWEDTWKVQIASGRAIPYVHFDDCREFVAPSRAEGTVIYVVVDGTPAVDYLTKRANAQLLSTIPRHGAAPFRVFSAPANSLESQAFTREQARAWPDCRGEGHYVSR